MSKTLKMSILLIIFTLGCLFLSQTEVKAVEVNSEEALTEAFTGADKTITLTGNIESEAIVAFDGADYILDLNGYKLTVGEFWINEGKLTINDAKGKGEIDTTLDWVVVCEGAELVINNGKVDYFVNEGKTTINNGAIDSINNYGEMIIEKGNFGGIWQRGNATINGGIFTGEVIASAIDLDNKKTILTGGEFKKGKHDYALMINSGSAIDGDVIKKFVGEGYIAIYGGYGMNSSSFEDEETGETIYLYEVTYDELLIMKDETEKIFDKIAPNGIWKVNGTTPKDMAESEFLLSAVASDIEVPEGYEVMAWCEPAEKFNPEEVTLFIYYNGHQANSKTVKAVYNKIDKAITDKVNPILDKIAKKTGEEINEETGFRLEDLYLINYLNATKTGIDSSSALNFAKDLIELTKGGNISYKYDTRMGSYTPTELWSFTGGQVIVYYGDLAIGTTRIGLTANHVLYVPNDTADTDEARIKAALERIEEYLGTTKGITIKVGGTLDSLNNEDCTWKDFGLIDDKTSGKNYYNVTINDETYKFAICKKDATKFETPKYLGSDVISEVTVTTASTELPLDTAVTVKTVQSEEIEKAIGTSTYAAYDISLYSNAKQVNIKKLENGKFTVSVPVPKILKDKEIIVYYVDSEGNKTEYVATVKDNLASFETDHFSTYVLAEKVEEEPSLDDEQASDQPTQKPEQAPEQTPGTSQEEDKGEKDDTPKTGNTDIISYVILATTIAGAGIVSLRKKN